MVEVYDAHEQGEIVKKWLSENGSAIVMGLVIAFGGLFGLKQWQAWQVNSRQQASVEFAVMGDLLASGQLDAAVSNFENLKEDYPDSPYTSMAAMQFATARISTSQPELAIGLYEFVIEKGYPKAMKAIARERLARVLLDQGQPDAALETLQGAEDITGLESRFAEVRGDIHFSQGQLAVAEADYLEALEKLEEGAGDRARLVMKLESMGAKIPVAGSDS
jgi:predicted negative regulator of RcsB-dependent stress response